MGRPTCGQGQPRHLQPMAQTLSRQHPLWTCSSQACGAARMQHFCLGFASKPRDQTRVAAASGVTLEQGDAAAAGPCLCIIVCSAACTGSKACVWVVTTGCGHLCVNAAVYLGFQAAPCVACSTANANAFPCALWVCSDFWHPAVDVGRVAAACMLGACIEKLLGIPQVLYCSPLELVLLPCVLQLMRGGWLLWPVP
jgi:hypothetical protein